MLHTLEELLLLQELHLLVLLGESAREDGLGVEGDLGLEPGQGGEQYSTVQYSTVPGEGGEHRVELLEAAGRGRAAAARGEAGHDRVDGGHGAQPPLRHTGPLSAEKPEQFSDI